MNILTEIFEEFYKAIGKGNPSCAVKGKSAAKVQRAKDTYKPITRKKRKLSKANELRTARGVKGRPLPDNEPMDVLFTKAGKIEGIEVKTIIEGSNKITMHKDSRLRKLAWAKRNKTKIHTVVIKGKTVYYREGVGSWDIKNMKKVDGGFKGLSKELKL